MSDHSFFIQVGVLFVISFFLTIYLNKQYFNQTDAKKLLYRLPLWGMPFSVLFIVLVFIFWMFKEGATISLPFIPFVLLLAYSLGIPYVLVLGLIFFIIALFFNAICKFKRKTKNSNESLCSTEDKKKSSLSSNSSKKNSQSSKIVIITVIIITCGLFLNAYFNSKNRVIERSVNLEDGSGVEKCTKAQAHLFGWNYECKHGYYKTKSFFGEKIFFYSLSTNELGTSTNLSFLKNVDIDSFRVLKGVGYRNYAVDKNQLYLNEDAYSTDANLQNVEILNYPYFKDENSIFTFHKNFTTKKLEGSKASDFTFLSDFIFNCIKSNGKTFCDGDQFIAKSDPAYIVEYLYVRDDETKLAKADLLCPNKTINGTEYKNEKNNHVYVDDSGRVVDYGLYFCPNKVVKSVEIDTETFERLTKPDGRGDLYARDKDNLYWCENRCGSVIHLIDGADPDNYEDEYVEGCKIIDSVPRENTKRDSWHSNLCNYRLK